MSLPDDLDNIERSPRAGNVRLPLHVYWSGPERTWDLDDRYQLMRVYEIVLTEGTEDDVR